MIDERHEELASLHTLDLLEGAERQQFEAAHAANPALQRLVRELRECSAALAHLAPTTPLPPSLKGRIIASIEGRAATKPREAGPGRSEEPRAFFRGPFVPWAMAAALALVAGWLAQRNVVDRGEIALLENQRALAEIALRSARNQLEAERLLAQRQFDGLARTPAASGALAGCRIVALTSQARQSPEALAVAVWDPARQEGFLQVEKLPALADGRDYQLWVIDPQYPSPVDGGVFSVDPASGAARIVFKSRQPVGRIDAFAVTLERKGGVPKAEGPFMLMGK